jgi:hypothetical protein
MSVRRLKTGAPKHTKFGLGLAQSAKEILAHVKGEAKPPTRLLYQSATAPGMGARTQETRRHYPRLSRSHQQEPCSSVGCTRTSTTNVSPKPNP